MCGLKLLVFSIFIAQLALSQINGEPILPSANIIMMVAIKTIFMLVRSAHGSTTFQIYWNTTNAIFRIDNTDHVIDVNKGNAPYEYDQLNLICPVYEPGTDGDTVETYIVYIVTEEEYRTCRITNPNPKPVAVCDKPYKMLFFTITFRPFSPQPEGFEFRPGVDYYFISTSSKDDLHRRIGGLCSTHNMKVMFKVCCSNSTTDLPDQSSSSSSTTPSTTTLLTQKTTKKMYDYGNHPNDVVKNEEFTYNSAQRITAVAIATFITLLSVVTFQY